MSAIESKREQRSDESEEKATAAASGSTTTTPSRPETPPNNNGADEHERHHHQASFVDPSGNFVTDDFLETLLGSGGRGLTSPQAARERVDKLRDDIRRKREAEERARQRLSGGGTNANGVSLVRSNAELDAALQQHFPGRDFLHATASVVRRAVLALAHPPPLDVRPENTLLVRCACPEDNVHVFRPSDFLSLCGDRGYPLGGVGGLPTGGLRGLCAASRMVGNVRGDAGRLVLEYGPCIGLSEFGEIGKILRADSRGSLLQRSACPTFSQDAYDTLLETLDDEADALTSEVSVRLRARRVARETFGEDVLKCTQRDMAAPGPPGQGPEVANDGRGEMGEAVAHSSSKESGHNQLDSPSVYRRRRRAGGRDEDYPQQHAMVAAMVEARCEALVNVWSRGGKSESLALAMYLKARDRVRCLIEELHARATPKGERRGDLLSKSEQENMRLAVPVLALGVIRVKTPGDFDDRVILMHCEWFAPRRRGRNCMQELEQFVDEFWDADSTDDED